MQEHIPAFSSLSPVGAALAARANQNRNSIRWRGPLCISKRADSNIVVTNIEVEIWNENVYWEKQVLIDAIEEWLPSFQEKSCGNLSCPCS